MVGVVYAVRDWDRHYENNRTREMKSMGWVPIPIRFDSDGYTELVSHPDGAAHYGVWIALVCVAGRCDPRGTLLRDGGRPHDPGTLARITRLDAKLIENALNRLVGIGWIERKALADNDPAGGCGIPAGAPHPTAMNGTEGTEGTEAARVGRKTSPAEALARTLAARLGSSLNPCRKQVQALTASGWSLDRIGAAIEEAARPGVAPWDWTKEVTSVPKNGHASKPCSEFACGLDAEPGGVLCPRHAAFARGASA